ncbi:MAG: hypothetical protein H6977_17410 [Gammaproteobacteria bacterium]|nr:hypothetical protein [Gammaproteobacteria bacterium]
MTASTRSLAAALALACAATSAAQAQILEQAEYLPYTTSLVNLDPGGFESSQDGFLHNFGEAEVTRQGSTVQLKAEGQTVGGANPTVIARAEARVIESNAARYFTANAHARLTYWIGVEPTLFLPGDSFDVPVTIYGNMSVQDTGIPNQHGGSEGRGSIDVGRFHYDDGSIPRANRVGDVMDFSGDFSIRTGTELSVTLNAYATANVESAWNGVQHAIAEVIVDPVFEFDQATYDLMRLGDPNLPDIVLADSFRLVVGPGLTAVPLPSAMLFLISALPLTWCAGQRRSRT